MVCGNVLLPAKPCPLTKCLYKISVKDGVGKALHLVKPDAFLDKVKAKELLVVLDVRAQAETFIYGVALPGTLMNPITEKHGIGPDNFCVFRGFRGYLSRCGHQQAVPPRCRVDEARRVCRNPPDAP
jgi:hypothetical protein